jgi:hypothetical protein
MMITNTKTCTILFSLAISLVVLNLKNFSHGVTAFGLTTTTKGYYTTSRYSPSPRLLHHLSASSSDDNNTPILKAPTFNGQLILPTKVVLNGLKGHNQVAAVYAIQPKKQSGYSAVKYISITRDLLSDLQSLMEKYPGQIEYI